MFSLLLAAARAPEVQSLDEVEALLTSLAATDLVAGAAAAGARTTRLGFAFAGGYPLAVRKLTGDPRPLALAVTEAGGNRPVDIEATLTRGISGGAFLTGTKTFVTMADRASHCLVLCKDGDADRTSDGRIPLLLVLAHLRDAHVTVEMLPPLPIATEVAHGKVTFARSPVEHIFDGDGWDQYGRPFRTIEDIAVTSASLGLLFRLTFEHTPAMAARALAILAALQSVEALGFGNQEGHLVLAGGISLATQLLQEALPSLANEVRANLEKDLPLLSIANRAREARASRAWLALSAPKTGL